ncbi:MAG: hypothetical protein JST68_05095, partial [Bacteroidetes bacterium]|nr:hypothetical protein [Bacteroidota bacterium]
MKPFYLFLLFLFLLGGTVRTAAQGISVSPARLFFAGGAGERVSQILTMANPTGKALRFKLVMRDFSRDSLGEKVYADAGSMPGSNAGWVDGLPDVVELGPGEKRDLPVYLRIPADSTVSQRGVSRSILFLSQTAGFDSTTAGIGGRKVGILVRLEVGVQIYYTPGWSSRRSLEFLAFDERGRVDTVRRWAVRV